MTPSEAAALLRIKQARERRMRTELEGARRTEREASAQRGQAEGAQQAFLEEAQQNREQAYGRLESAEVIRAASLQATDAHLADLRAQEAQFAVKVRDAAAAERKRRTETEGAVRRHGLAQRGAEAFVVVTKEVRAAAAAAEEAAEELEMEEVRSARGGRRTLGG